jgi:hypothetical protein
MRSREDTGEIVRVNPVWVPAVGDASTAITYQFLDATAESGVAYVYWIEGITIEGLPSPSESVPITRLRAAR